MSDTDIWGLLVSPDNIAHLDHGGWTQDGRSPEVLCACGTVLAVPAGVTS